MTIKCTYRKDNCDKEFYSSIDDDWTVADIREHVNDLILDDLGVTRTSWEVVEE